MFRYLDEEDLPVRRPVFRRALMQIPYIDENAGIVAWKEGQVLPIVGRLDDGSLVLRVIKGKQKLLYVVDVGSIGRVLVEMFDAA